MVLSKKKGFAVAAIAIAAVVGGLYTYSIISNPVEPGSRPEPERILTTIDRNSSEDNENDSTTVAENVEEPVKLQENQTDNGTVFANNTVIANNTIIINKPVYHNNTIIYQPVTINLESYKTTINQHIELEKDNDAPADKSHSLTIRAERIASDGWSKRFTDDDVGMFTTVYDIKGNLVKKGYADERGFVVRGLENKLYFVFPADCHDCGKSKDDILFKQWEDGSKDRPRLVPADSTVTASYRLVPEKTKQTVTPPSENPPEETLTAAEPTITLQAHNATYVYGWVQITAQLENKVAGYDDLLIRVYKPDGSLHDSFAYSDQQGFFTPRAAGEGNYRIVAAYDYPDGTVENFILHPVKFSTPHFVNFAASKDDGTVRVGGLLRGGLAGENVTIAISDPEGQQAGKYLVAFGTKPVFSLFIPNEDARTIFNKTGNYTFVATHVETGTQGTTTLFQANENETETAAELPVNVSHNAGRSENVSLAIDGDNLYLVWEDDTSGSQDILFAKSADAGSTFSEPVTISRQVEGGFSSAPDIAALGNNVYIVWEEYNSEEQAAPAFSWSSDGGMTFSNQTILGNYTGENTRPNIGLLGETIYISWIVGAEEEFTGDLMLARSSNGTDFEAATVAQNTSGLQMASSGDNLYLAWRHYPSGDTTEGNYSNIVASSDDGLNFETSDVLQGITMYSIAASADNIYVAGVDDEGNVTVGKSSGGSFDFVQVASGDFPDIAVIGNNVTVVWTSEDGLFFTSGSDGAFEERQVISNEGFSPAVAVSERSYVAWTQDSDIMLVIR